MVSEEFKEDNKVFSSCKRKAPKQIAPALKMKKKKKRKKKEKKRKKQPSTGLTVSVGLSDCEWCGGREDPQRTTGNSHT